MEWRSFTVLLPYVREVSESLRRALVPLGARVSYRPANTLRQILSKPKDPVPTLQKSGVVYKISCNVIHWPDRETFAEEIG